MKPWLIEPRDPLIARDGRPFDGSPGGHARTLAFPMPSTVAGGARTRAGLDEAGRFVGDSDRLLRYGLRGPLLVEVRHETVAFFAPAPADAVMHDGVRVYRLRPERLRSGEFSDLPSDLMHVFSGQRVGGKPGGMPAHWHWERFERWLLRPADEGVSSAELGIEGPVHAFRTHVALMAGSLTAVEGALFQTSGLEFTWTPGAEDLRGRRLAGARRLALAIETDAPVRPGLAPLAGERRLVTWRAGVPLPGCPAGLPDLVAENRACRLVLLTPGYFEGGYRPRWVCSPRHGVTAEVAAAVVHRPVVASGWDLRRARPKPTRRLAPAGSVYFLHLQGDEVAIRKWVKDLWLQSVSDDEQSRRDGFGLAAIGVWEGVT